MALVTPVEPVPLGELGRVHFAGLGGTGMSGIARTLLARGVALSGSDMAPSDRLDELAALGARVHVGHAAANLDGADTLVVSSAIRPDNPELAEARRRGIRVLHRAAALGSAMLGRRGIAIAGTHGKTTTTSMVTTILRSCGADPSYVIGGILAETGLGAADGRGQDFIAEADESDGSFLMLSPQAAVVTCIEADHLDNYGSLAEIEAAFLAFAARISAGGLLVAGADYRLGGVTARGMATEATVTPGPRARVSSPGGISVRIRVPGRHNALNAAAALAVAIELGYPPDQAAAGLAAYGGARRRMEPKGEADGVRVLDSYAHHPTELAADLTAARDVAAGGRVIAVFQPHLYSRTRFFAAQFGAALGLADEALVLDVYAAREEPEPGVSGQLVADAVPGGRARFLPDAADVPEVIAGLAKPGDLVLTMGAGDVTSLGPLIVAALHDRAGE